MQYSRTTDKDLQAFCRFVCQFLDSQTVEETYTKAIEAMSYYSGSIDLRQTSLHPIEEAWYASVHRGDPDYSLYGAPYFTSEMWACWKFYSSKFLRTMHKGILQEYGMSLSELMTGTIDTVLDMGNGVGLTTSALKEIYPDSTVYGFNLDGTDQYRIAEENARVHDFHQISDLQLVEGTRPMVWATEFFEHIVSPLDLVTELHETVRPSVWVIANSFGSRSMGHFETYYIKGRPVGGKAIGRKFNDHLRRLGYEKLETGYWNSRPTVWTYSTN